MYACYSSTGVPLMQEVFVTQAYFFVPFLALFSLSSSKCKRGLTASFAFGAGNGALRFAFRRLRSALRGLGRRRFPGRGNADTAAFSSPPFEPPHLYPNAKEA